MNVLLVAGLTACASAPIGGAPAGARPLTFSQPVAGVLSETDPTLSERGHFHVYAFDGTRGQRVRVMMSSNAFDTYLSVARNVGGLTDVVGTDDGGAGGTDSRVMLTLPEDGTYLVLAQAYGAGEVGSYLLEAALPADAVEMSPQPLQIGQRVQGELSASDRLMDDGSEIWSRVVDRG